MEFFFQRIKCTCDIALLGRLIRLFKNLTLNHQKTACCVSHKISPDQIKKQINQMQSEMVNI